MSQSRKELENWLNKLGQDLSMGTSLDRMFLEDKIDPESLLLRTQHEKFLDEALTASIEYEKKLCLESKKNPDYSAPEKLLIHELLDFSKDSENIPFPHRIAGFYLLYREHDELLQFAFLNLFLNMEKLGISSKDIYSVVFITTPHPDYVKTGLLNKVFKTSFIVIGKNASKLAKGDLSFQNLDYIIKNKLNNADHFILDTLTGKIFKPQEFNLTIHAKRLNKATKCQNFSANVRLSADLLFPQTCFQILHIAQYLIKKFDPIYFQSLFKNKSLNEAIETKESKISLEKVDVLPKKNLKRFEQRVAACAKLYKRYLEYYPEFLEIKEHLKVSLNQLDEESLNKHHEKTQKYIRLLEKETLRTSGHKSPLITVSEISAPEDKSSAPQKINVEKLENALNTYKTVYKNYSKLFFKLSKKNANQSDILDHLTAIENKENSDLDHGVFSPHYLMIENDNVLTSRINKVEKMTKHIASLEKELQKVQDNKSIVSLQVSKNHSVKPNKPKKLLKEIKASGTSSNVTLDNHSNMSMELLISDNHEAKEIEASPTIPNTMLDSNSSTPIEIIFDNYEANETKASPIDSHPSEAALSNIQDQALETPLQLISNALSGKHVFFQLTTNDIGSNPLIIKPTLKR